MPRKPNYGLERSERRKIKDAKKAARLQAKTDQSEARKAKAEESGPDEPEDNRD